MNFEQVFGGLPTEWDGRDAILELKSHDYNWRQMEWIGFYFQHLIRKNSFESGFEMPGRRFVSGDFDGFFESYDWDLKTHASIDQHGRRNTICILNDAATIDLALSQKGAVYIAVAEGVPRFDLDGDFQAWHEEIKGAPSQYVLDGRSIGRSSRIRKSSFRLTSVNIYKIAGDSPLGIMRQGRNSNGSPRPLKYTLDIAAIKPVAIL